MNMPIIRLEVERMNYQIKTALMQHQVEMDEYVMQAIEEVCKPENIKAVIFAEASRVFEATLKAEVDNFFRYGEGRKAVAMAIKEMLLKNETYTPLDFSEQEATK